MFHVLSEELVEAIAFEIRAAHHHFHTAPPAGFTSEANSPYPPWQIQSTPGCNNNGLRYICRQSGRSNARGLEPHACPSARQCYDFRCRRAAFALFPLPASFYSSNSVRQLLSCNLLSNCRTSLDMRSTSACQAGTEKAALILISVFLAR